MDIKFVVPKGVDLDTKAYEEREGTWREIAGEYEIEFADSAWCVDNEIDGLGFVEAKTTIEPPVEQPGLMAEIVALKARLDQHDTDITELKRGKETRNA